MLNLMCCDTKIYLFCHSEQSEESDEICQILRFAQNDKIQVINVVIKN